MNFDRLEAAGLARVLIVEDIVFRAMEIEHALTTRGCNVVGYAYDLPSALRSAERDHPDVALVSLELNDLSGRDEVVESLSRMGVGCVLLTEGDPARTDQNSAVACLHQPCADDQMTAAVSAAYLHADGLRPRGPRNMGASTQRPWPEKMLDS